MPGLFSRLKSRDGARSKKKNATNDFTEALPEKPKWDDAYARKTVEPEEIHELIRCCTDELKARGMSCCIHGRDAACPTEREPCPRNSTAWFANAMCYSRPRSSFSSPPVPTDLRPQCRAHLYPKFLRPA